METYRYEKHIIGIIMVLFFIAAGCSSNESKLIGVWEPDQKTIAGEQVHPIEFFKDHTIQFGWRNGTWTVLDDGRIKIDWGRFTFGKLKGNVLTIEYGQGKTITYHRQAR
jgi:hypothetical protein